MQLGVGARWRVHGCRSDRTASPRFCGSGRPCPSMRSTCTLLDELVASVCRALFNNGRGWTGGCPVSRCEDGIRRDSRATRGLGCHGRDLDLSERLVKNPPGGHRPRERQPRMACSRAGRPFFGHASLRFAFSARPTSLCRTPGSNTCLLEQVLCFSRDKVQMHWQSSRTWSH